MIDSGERVQALLDDLTDFNRANLGLGIAIAPTECELGVLCAEELARMRDDFPDRALELHAEGDCRGRWDGLRLKQLVCNLVTNAVKYGAADAPVQVALAGDADGVRLEVVNRGPTVPPDTLAHVFEPLSRGPNAAQQPGLGLGLFIVHEIAHAHGGTVEARSADGVTVFAVRLPRQGPSPTR